MRGLWEDLAAGRPPAGTGGARVLSDADLPRALALCAQDPVAAVLATTRLEQAAAVGLRRAGGQLWGYEVDGTLVGQLNVSQLFFGSLSSCAIGYWIAQRVAGRGLMPTAVALATDYCFLQLGLHRVEICIRPENDPSLRVVEKLGFRYEGLRRRYIHIDGAWRDHFTFAMTYDEAPFGILRRWQAGEADPRLARVPDADRIAAGVSPSS